MIPSIIAMSCLNVDSGAELDTTARLSVQRKNAMASISKALLLIIRRNAQYAHITMVSIANDNSTDIGSFAPSAAIS